MEGLIRNSDGGCIAAGSVVIAMDKSASCEWLWQPRDPAMTDAFRSAAHSDPGLPSLLDVIADHQSVVYLIKNEPGASAVEEIVKIADFCLDAGGFGVKSETAGLGHSPERWKAPLRALGNIQLHDLLVFPLIQSDQGYYSCGMNQFGKRDTIICTDSPEEASEIIRMFELYQLLEEPEMKNGQIFAAEAGGVPWLMSETIHPYADDPHIDFSFGAWKLTRVDEGMGKV